MKDNTLIFASGEQFAHAFDMESMPPWKAAGYCPFCQNKNVRMQGEYVEKESPYRSGTLKRKLLVWAQIVCPACGAAGSIAKREVPISGKVSCGADMLDKLSQGNRMLMITAASMWNRRYT